MYCICTTYVPFMKCLEQIQVFSHFESGKLRFTAAFHSFRLSCIKATTSGPSCSLREGNLWKLTLWSSPFLLLQPTIQQVGIFLLFPGYTTLSPPWAHRCLHRFCGRSAEATNIINVKWKIVIILYVWCFLTANFENIFERYLKL